MPRKCSICSAEDREKIDRGLASGGAIPRIAALFQCSPDALQRHKSHIAEALVRSAERAGESLEDRLVSGIENVQKRLWEVFEAMRDGEDLRGAVVALKEIRECLESIDRIVSKAKGSPTEQQILAEITEHMRVAVGRMRTQPQLPPAADVTVTPVKEGVGPDVRAECDRVPRRT